MVNPIAFAAALGSVLVLVWLLRRLRQCPIRITEGVEAWEHVYQRPEMRELVCTR